MGELRKLPSSKFSLPPYDSVRVLVCGDVMLDRYWQGDISRISPEAPVPVVQVQQLENRPGGAANVALNMMGLGARVSLLGQVGDDEEGRILRALLQQAKVDCFFQKLLGERTVTKLRILGQHQQLLRLDFETIFKHIDPDWLLNCYEQQLTTVQMVVLSDYAKGTLSCLSELLKRAKAHHVPVCVDPKSKDFSIYRGATLITPNIKEFEAVAGPCADETTIIQRARRLMGEHDFTAMLITRGSEGMILVGPKDRYMNLSTVARQVYDVTGAGDTVIAVMAASLAVGFDFEEAAQLANVAAGVAVGKLGAGPVSAAELRTALHTQNTSQAGIVTLSELLRVTAQARKQSLKIVMTNGCFDLLHAGHVYYLEEARKLGDCLIVAINDDASVSRLKGMDRPINSLLARMEVLAALRSVDWVIPFSEDTPLQLIETIRPDVLVKGADYAAEDIVGADVVQRFGGHVTTIPLKQGHATSALIQKIKIPCLDE